MVNKKIFFRGIVIFLLIFISVLYFSSDKIIQYLYNHRTFIDFFSEDIGNDYENGKDLNFTFSINDLKYFNSIKNKESDNNYGSRKVDLKIEDRNYELKISNFNNYFEKIDISDKPAFSIKSSKNDYIENIRNYDVFQLKNLNFYEQMLIYDFAKKMGIYTPKTEKVNLIINGTKYGQYIFKQAYDNVFLEQNSLSDSYIFKVNVEDDFISDIDFLVNEAENNIAINHVEKFIDAFISEDENILVKYFDLDYLSRFETLRELLNSNSSFIIDENIKIIYNRSDGKFYPILDESNIINLTKNKSNRAFEFLYKKISDNEFIQNSKIKYLNLLYEDYDELNLKKNEIFESWKRSNKGFIPDIQFALVSEYFKRNVYKNLNNAILKNFKSQSIKFVYQGNNKLYLDNMVLSLEEFVKRNRELDFVIDGDNLILKKGTYVVKKDIFIPMGTIFEIEEGVDLKIYPEISIISYSPINVRGTFENPVIIEAFDKNEPFAVFAVIGSGTGLSKVNNMDFSGGNEKFIEGVFYSGGLNFHNMNLQMKNSKIHNNHADDGLNIKNGDILLGNNEFYSNFADQVDLDFCRGIVKSNKFIDDGGDMNGDGLDFSGSEILVQENLFSGFSDKGVSIGENTKCFLYKNIIENNGKGVASKDMSRVALLENRFSNNVDAISAYQKKQIFGGGNLYVFSNTFVENINKFSIDKISRMYNLSNETEYKKKFVNEINKGEINYLFDAFDKMISEYRYEEVSLKSFFIGDKEGKIDEINKVIFVNLNNGEGVLQNINFESNKAETRVTIISNGNMSKKEFNLNSNDEYNFERYIFRGKICLYNGYNRKEYELYVTTGNVPIIEIDTRNEYGEPLEIKDEPKISCSVRIFSENDSKYVNGTLPGKIEGRGIKWSGKWKYSFNLEDSYSLEGMVKSKKWVLESSFIDTSLMRNKISFDLLEEFREEKSRQKVATESRFAELFLNGEYQGVYLLMEHINNDLLDLEEFDINEDNNALLYNAENWNNNFLKENINLDYHRNDYRDLNQNGQPLNKKDDLIWGWHSGYLQKWPDKEIYGEHWNDLEEFVEFVAVSSDEDFRNEIFNFLDIDNFIDFWILIELVDDSDGTGNNQYLAKHKGKNSKWFFVPWDNDGVMGRLWNMKKRGTYSTWLESNLFNRCMRIDEFRDKFIERWDYLVDIDIIDSDNIISMIDENSEFLSDAQKRNFEKWKYDSTSYPEVYGFYEEIEYMKDWINNRIGWINSEIRKK